MKSFWTAWGRCFGRGLHALVALIVSGFAVEVVMYAIIGALSFFIGGEQVSALVFDMVLPLVCFTLIGLPLFGFLFSGAYSASEPVGKTDTVPGSKG